MNRYRKYAIMDTDRFDPDYFTKVRDETTGLMTVIINNPGPFAEMIILAYLQEGSLKQEWTDANPGLCNILVEKNCTTTHLESLFASSKDNLQFTRELEDYIRKQITDIPAFRTGS
jgi:hypothetical protein